MGNNDDFNRGTNRFRNGLPVHEGSDPLEIMAHQLAEEQDRQRKIEMADLKKRREAQRMPATTSAEPVQNQTKNGNEGALVFFGILAAFVWMLSGNNSKIDPEAVASPVTDSRKVAAPLSKGEFNCTARGEAISLTFSFHRNTQADGQLVEHSRVIHPTEPNVINLESISNKSKSCDQAYSKLFKIYPKP